MATTVSFNTQFPGYEILGELSRSNARVLKARHLATGDLVAIKHFSLTTDADTLRRFERESTLMARLAHPNIVKVRETRLDAELPFIVMDLFEEGSVRQLLNEQKRLSVATTIRLGLQLVDAFSAIHPQGIVHRDIKPENVLFRRLPSEELHFLLTDFGVARLGEQSVTVTGQSLLTYEYAAPEQFDNPRQVGPAADYYALGVVLYECLSGQVPFAMSDGIGVVTFMNTVLTTPPPAITELPDRPLPQSLADLLRGLLVKSANERTSNPDVVKLALKQAELEQLRIEQGSHAEVAKPRTAVTATLTEPATARPAQSPVIKSDEPALIPQKKHIPHVRSRRQRWGWVVLGIALLLCTAWAVYYATTERKVNPQSTAGQSTRNVAGSTIAAGKEDDSAQRLADSLRLVQQRRQEGLAAAKLLKAELLRGRVGLFGGVKGMTLRLRNPTKLRFRYVLVKVRYVKENGELFKTEDVYVYEVEPNDTKIVRVPDSSRGTRFSARIIGYESPDIPAIPTELQQQVPTDSAADTLQTL